MGPRLSTLKRPAKQRERPLRKVSSEQLYNFLQDTRAFFIVVDLQQQDSSNRRNNNVAARIDYSVVSIDSTHLLNEAVTAAFQHLNGKVEFTLVLYGGQECETDRFVKTVLSGFKRDTTTHRLLEVWLLQDHFNSFQSQYPFMCTDHPFYSPGRLFPSHIHDNLYISSWGIASDADLLRAMGITHVVNCTPDHPFASEGTTNFRVPVADSREQDIHSHLCPATDFIAAALAAEPPGRVLVHCRHGHSRSATVAMAYLLRCHPTRFPDVEAAVAHCRAFVRTTGSGRSCSALLTSDDRGVASCISLSPAPAQLEIIAHQCSQLGFSHLMPLQIELLIMHA